jgi:hypothetical protein
VSLGFRISSCDVVSTLIPFERRVGKAFENAEHADSALFRVFRYFSVFRVFSI